MIFFKSISFLEQHARITQRTCRRGFQYMPRYEHVFKKFNASYPELKKYMLNHLKQDWAKERYNRMLDDLLGRGRQAKPAVALKVHEVMTSASGSDADSKSLQRIHVMAWIVETLNGAGVMADDFIDDSTMRRGQIPWYREKGKFILTDFGMILIMPYFLLHDWFGEDKFYHSSAKLLQKYCADINLMQQGDVHIIDALKKRELSWKKYRDHCNLKADYTVYLPFKLAVFEATKLDFQFDELTNEILGDIAFLLQLGNDSETVIPKPKNNPNIIAKDYDEDIKFGKVDFAVTFFMNNATEKDKDILMANYGNNDQKRVDIVRRLYDKYDVPNEMAKYIENHVKSTEEKIGMVSNEYRLREGLTEALEVMKLYPKSDPAVKNDYPEG